MNTEILSLGSVTYAIKAKKILLNKKIHSKLIKIDSSDKNGGCIYGLKVAEKDYRETVIELKRSGISFSNYES